MASVRLFNLWISLFWRENKKKVILNGFSIENCLCGLSCNLSLDCDETFVLDLLFLGVVCLLFLLKKKKNWCVNEIFVI